MARARLNPRLAKLHRPYLVGEVAETFAVNEQTVRRWIVFEGLQPVDDGRPTLIKGAVLRQFLERRAARPVRERPPGTLYCFGCKGFRRPVAGLIDFEVGEGATTGDLRGLCESCNSIMHRATRRDDVALVLPNVEVRVVEAAPRIVGRAGPPLNVNSKRDSRT